jgi:hypothetical protein
MISILIKNNQGEQEIEYQMVISLISKITEVLPTDESNPFHPLPAQGYFKIFSISSNEETSLIHTYKDIKQVEEYINHYSQTKDFQEIVISSRHILPTLEIVELSISLPLKGNPNPYSKWW